jgi:Bacteroidetes-specific putative membrane protein
MEKRRLLCLISLLLLSCIARIQAQWDDTFSQYWIIKGYFNPAFAGETKQIKAAVLYRYQWTGIENAPKKVVLTADMPFEFFGRRHGAGLAAYTETIGDLRNSLLAAQYSFKKEIGKGFLNIGLQAGVYDLHFDAGSKHIFTDSLQHSRGMLKVNPADKQVIDLSAGISWTGRRVFAGISALHITQPAFYAHNDSISSADLLTDSLLSVIPRSYNFMAGYNITFFHPLEIQPMLWAQTDFEVIEVQATLRIEYNKKFSGGVSWRMNDGYTFFAGATIEGVQVGYAYDLYTAGMGKDSKGSHEVYLRYNIPYDLSSRRHPHKSIRLL